MNRETYSNGAGNFRDIRIRLNRDALSRPWGFRLSGGVDCNEPLTISRVYTGSPADKQLWKGDLIQSLDNFDITSMTHKQVQNVIRIAGKELLVHALRPMPLSEEACYDIAPAKVNHALKTNTRLTEIKSTSPISNLNQRIASFFAFRNSAKEHHKTVSLPNQQTNFSENIEPPCKNSSASLILAQHNGRTSNSAQYVATLKVPQIVVEPEEPVLNIAHVQTQRGFFPSLFRKNIFQRSFCGFGKVEVQHHKKHGLQRAASTSCINIMVGNSINDNDIDNSDYGFVEKPVSERRKFFDFFAKKHIYEQSQLQPHLNSQSQTQTKNVLQSYLPQTYYHKSYDHNHKELDHQAVISSANFSVQPNVPTNDYDFYGADTKIMPSSTTSNYLSSFKSASHSIKEKLVHVTKLIIPIKNAKFHGSDNYSNVGSSTIKRCYSLPQISQSYGNAWQQQQQYQSNVYHLQVQPRLAYPAHVN